MSLEKKLKKAPGPVIGGFLGKELLCLNHGIPAWIAYGLGAKAAYSQAKESVSSIIKENIASFMYDPAKIESYNQALQTVDKPVDYATTAGLIVGGAIAGHYVQKQLLKIPVVKKGYDKTINSIANNYNSAKNYIKTTTNK